VVHGNSAPVAIARTECLFFFFPLLPPLLFFPLLRVALYPRSRLPQGGCECRGSTDPSPFSPLPLFPSSPESRTLPTGQPLNNLKVVSIDERHLPYIRPSAARFNTATILNLRVSLPPPSPFFFFLIPTFFMADGDFDGVIVQKYGGEFRRIDERYKAVAERVRVFSLLSPLFPPSFFFPPPAVQARRRTQ